MDSAVKAISGLLGGLALFLYGMGAMSRAMEEGAGPSLRRVLARSTRTPLRGALAGALATAVLQSSSAVTVTVIGFVSAGLLGLPQAIAVGVGANVGTTVTAQLTALSPDAAVYPLLFAGAVLEAAGKGERVRALGRAVFSFGLLLLGVGVMGSALEPVTASPRFTALLARAGDSPALGLVMGAALTAAVQSSSAAIALLQKLAAQAGPDRARSALGLLGALPMLLGSNIGTTVTALIAGTPGVWPWPIFFSTSAERWSFCRCCPSLPMSRPCSPPRGQRAPSSPGSWPTPTPFSTLSAPPPGCPSRTKWPRW